MSISNYGEIPPERNQNNEDNSVASNASSVKKLFSASDAKQRTERCAITLDKIMEQIISASDGGRVEYILHSLYISDDIFQGLLRSGFSIREVKGPIGDRIIVVSWL